MTRALSRRDFLQASVAAGTGLVVAVQLQGCGGPGAPPATAAFAPNAWVRVDTDGTVRVVVDRSEMGQGVATALPMLVAEELEADWASVRFEQAPAHPAYANKLTQGTQTTGGSTAVMNGWIPLRQAGAAARTMLVQAAATRWGVEPSSCRAERGRVLHDASGRALGYGELATEAARLPVPDGVPLKDPSQWRLLGTPVQRLDVPDMVRGVPAFAGDVRVPGMLVAVVARCPVHGGVVTSLDDARAKATPGVRAVLRITGGVAVVADDFWAATRGRAALDIGWDEGPGASRDSAQLRAALLALAQGEPHAVPRHDGDANAAIAGATTTVEAQYEAPYLAHATMEPMVCAADVRPDGVTVWAPTQYQWGPAMFGGGARGVAAKVAGVDADRVVIHTTRLGGGFGRRAEMDFIVDAVEVSKGVGAPVRVVWTREDDIRHDWYRPQTLHLLEGAIDTDGRPVAWRHRIAAPSILERYLPSWIPTFVANRIGLLKEGADPTSIEAADNLPYAIPNLQVSWHRADRWVPIGFWRSVGHSQNGFVVECFLDELARLAGRDPVDYRRDLLQAHPRHLAVLELAASKAGWGSPAPAGRARGVAVVASFGSYVAQVAEVSLVAGGVRVHRVTCAVDCGRVVNPDIVVAQVEGGVAFGLTAALRGEITLAQGRVVQGNFHDYPLLRLDEMPVVDVHVVPSSEPPGGVGEIAVPPVAPAVANAVAVLTGQPVRSLPIRVG
ncbi:MAG: xanthine dehydrogenase family protein molybdopterin-binding subunit [Gemmatimonadales bacterium]|nr:xanthine dehydrogenase family protein molybdopterin-binding subunit [Gemmatimonadales bacterium]